MLRSLLLITLLAYPAVLFAQPNSGIIRRYTFIDSGRLMTPTSSTGTALPPTLDLDFSQPVAGTITANTGQTLTVAGTTPTKVSDGTWPSGLSGTQGSAWRFYGGRIQTPITPPAGSFSFVAQYTPLALDASTDLLAATSLDGAHNGWWLDVSGTTVTFAVSDNGTYGGGHYSYVQRSGCLALNRRSVVAVTYDASGGDGHAIGTIYCDEVAANSSSTMDAPIYSGTSNLGIADSYGGGTSIKGYLHHFAYWDGVVLTATDVQKIRRCGFQGLCSSGGNMPTITVASPGAFQVAADGSGTEPYLIDLGTNMSVVGSRSAGTGGFVIKADRDNYAQRSSFETCAGGNPTGWTVVENAGDGTAAADCDTTTFAHAQTSLKFALTGTTSNASATGACLTGGVGAPVYVDFRAKKISGTVSISAGLLTYSDGACANDETLVPVLAASALTTSWSRYPIRADGDVDMTSIGSYKVTFLANAGAAGVANIDAVQVVAYGNGDVPPIGYCGCDTDATCSCSNLIADIGNPLGGSRWQFEGIWRQPWGVTDLTDLSINWYLLYHPGTATTNVWSIQTATDLDAIWCAVHTDAANYQGNYGGTWPADTDNLVRCAYWNDGVNGVIDLARGTTWYANQFGPGPARMSGAGDANLYLCSQSTNAVDCEARDLVFRRRGTKP